MRLKYFLLSFLMLVFIHQFSFAQVSVTDKKGDKIILMPDGTWKYADGNKQASVSNTVKAKQQTGQANIDKSKLSKAEKKQLKAQAEADKRRKKIAEKVAKQQKAKTPKGTAKTSKKPSKKDKASKKTAKTDKKPSKKDNKNTAKTSKKPSKKDKKTKNTAKTNKKPAKKGNSKKNVAKANKKPSKNNKINGSAKGVTQKKAKASTVSNKQKIKQAKRSLKAFKTKSVVIREYNCTYAINEIDAFTGKRKVALENDFFFGYTHPQLEKYLKGENYLSCEGYLQQVGGLKIFNVKFTIDSPNATEDYGSILEGSRMLVSLLDGSTVTLVSAEQDGGKIDRIDKQTTYKTYFVIDGKAEKQLQKSEIDQVRVVWSEGFEDYEIHNVDFIMNQLQCLNAAFK